MLVMLAPSFDGSSAAYARLVKATGMLAYDLKSRLKPGVWGVVRALADQQQAQELLDRLLAESLPALIVPREVAHDANRRIVTIRALELGSEHLVIHLREREMTIPFGALSCVVRGEVHTGHVPSRGNSPSSATFRAATPISSEPGSVSNFEAYSAADLHFATVLWVARLDARNFDFSALGLASESPASDLDQLVEVLSKRAGVRVDRGVRASSVVSTLTQSGGSSRSSGTLAAVRSKEPSDERFGPYSRVIGEAERLLAQARKVA